MAAQVMAAMNIVFIFFLFGCSPCHGAAVNITEWIEVPVLSKGDDVHFYLGLVFKASWITAHQYCRAHHMELASITTREENDKLQQALHKTTIGVEPLWTSGVDFPPEVPKFKRCWYWISTGRRFGFDRWAPDEPNGPGVEHCLTVELEDKKLVWKDKLCTDKAYFICEIRKSCCFFPEDILIPFQKKKQ